MFLEIVLSMCGMWIGVIENVWFLIRWLWLCVGFILFLWMVIVFYVMILLLFIVLMFNWVFIWWGFIVVFLWLYWWWLVRMIFGLEGFFWWGGWLFEVMWFGVIGLNFWYVWCVLIDGLIVFFCLKFVFMVIMCFVFG